jgi:hypothetical protein
MDPRLHPLSWFTLLTVLTIILIGVGCSDSPTDPAPSGGGGPVFADVPAIPEPSTLGGDVPATSGTLTRVEQLDSVFRPNVVDAYGAWSGVKLCPTGSQELPERNTWSSNLFGDFDYSALARIILGRRMVFQDAAGMNSQQHFEQGYAALCQRLSPTLGRVEANYRGPAFEVPVHVRRDRHWELKPLEGSAGDYLLVYPQTSGEVSTSYASGSERSQTEEFGRSLTAEVSAGYGVLSASVSGTLSETFSSSVTVNETTTETFTKSVTGKPGKIVQFMVWEMVENYSFCDADGNALESENFVIAAETMTRRGTAIALQSTEFDLP